MASLETMNLLIDGMYVVFMTINSIYLLIRAVRLKSGAIFFLALTFISFLITVVINQLIPPDNNLVRSLTAALYCMFLIIFTKMSFYISKKSNFKIVLAIVIALRVVHLIEMNLFGYAVPSYKPIPPEGLGIYYLHVLILASQLCIAFSWLSWASFKAYAQSKNEMVEPWVRHRHLLIGVSNGLYILSSFAFFLIPTDGLAYASPGALLADIVTPILLMGYFISSTLAFVVPDWFKRLLNSGQSLLKVEKDAVIFHDVPAAIVDQVLNSKQVLNAIDYLGGKLAVMIDKTPDAAKGFLLMAIDKEMGEFGSSVLRLDNLLHVVNNSLKQMMMEFHIDNYDEIATKLSDEIVKNQSLFLMIAM